MPICHLEHFLVQTTDLRASADWYVKVLGMREGWHPDFKFPVIWLYIGDRDVLHLTEGGQGVSDNRIAYLGQHAVAEYGSGVVDHVAFRCEDLAGMLAHLRSLGVDFQERMVSDQGLYQLFMLDPNGLKVELNFSNEEAQKLGIKPGLVASTLISQQGG
jgi:catechol 2,3-dioxygenase-like lactoylglutathione lyase family enzyme